MVITEKLSYLNQYKKCLKTITQLINWKATYLLLVYAQRIFTILEPGIFLNNTSTSWP